MGKKKDAKNKRGKGKRKAPKGFSAGEVMAVLLDEASGQPDLSGWTVSPLPTPDRITSTLAWALYCHAVHVDGLTLPAPHGWVDGWVLSHPMIGTTRFHRHIVALRAAGQVIDERVKPGQGPHGRVMEYRMGGTP